MEQYAEHLAVLTAIETAVADLSRAAAVLAGADDETAALDGLRREYGFTHVQAQAVLDCQLAAVTKRRRARLAAQIEALHDGLAGAWDPPLDMSADVHSPRHVTLGLDGEEWEVHGADADDCLDRLVRSVREEVAAPRRRRVTVTTGPTDGPRRILIDPVGGASFHYDDEAAPVIDR